MAAPAREDGGRSRETSERGMEAYARHARRPCGSGPRQRIFSGELILLSLPAAVTMAVPPPAVTVVMVMTVTMPMIVVVSLCAGIDRVSRFAKWGYWRRDGAGCCRKSQTGGTECCQDIRPHVLLPDRCSRGFCSS